MRGKYNTIVRMVVIIASLGGLHGLGFGQAIRGVHVFSERDDEDSRKCNLSSASVVASAEAALRFNRVVVSNSRSEEIKLYIVNTAIDLTGENRCVLGQYIAFKKYGTVNINQSGRSLLGDLILCDKNNVGIFSRSNVQSRANETVRQMTDLCLSEIEKDAR